MPPLCDERLTVPSSIRPVLQQQKMQAVARLRLLKDLVGANILPVVALQSVADTLGARGVSRGNPRWQGFRYMVLHESTLLHRVDQALT